MRSMKFFSFVRSFSVPPSLSLSLSLSPLKIYINQRPQRGARPLADRHADLKDAVCALLTARFPCRGERLSTLLPTASAAWQATELFVAGPCLRPLQIVMKVGQLGSRAFSLCTAVVLGICASQVRSAGLAQL